MLNLQRYFSMKCMSLWPFLSPRTHTYINDPTKWISICNSSTQPSGFTHFDSTTQPSGFTNLTQVLTWLNITILHHRSQHDLFIKLQIWLFIIKIKESQSWDQITANQENANNASFPHDQCSCLACASWTLSTANHQGIFINNIREWNRIMRTGTPPEIPNSTAAVLKNADPEKFLSANTHMRFSVYKLAYICGCPAGNPHIQFNLLYLIRSDLLHGIDYSKLFSEIFECFPR